MNEVIDVEQKIIIDNQKRLFISKVDSVDFFNDEILKLTVNNRKIAIKGKNIKITQFVKQNGNFMADGEFYNLAFGGEKTTLIKKIFK